MLSSRQSWGLQVALRIRKQAICSTPLVLQLQHRERIMNSQGAGLTTHMSMAKTSPNTRGAAAASPAAPPADLFRTPVHQGLGTSADDPYTRTLPNVPSVPPESTVLVTAATTAPTLDEVAVLSKKMASMQYWLGDSHPRLIVFVQQLLVPEALPVSSSAEKLVGQFATHVLPALLRESHPQELQDLLKQWHAAEEAYRTVELAHVFDRKAFEHALKDLHERTLAAMMATIPVKETSLALEVLRRQAVLQRNRFIETHLLQLLQSSAYLGGGDAVWRTFFEAVAKHKAELFQKSENQTLSFAWDAVMLADVVRAPSVSAPVAFYLTALAVFLSRGLIASPALQDASRHLDEGVGHVAHASSDFYSLLNPITKRQVVMAELKKIMSSAGECRKLAKALRRAGLHDISREVALCEALNDDRALREADAAEVASEFDSTSEVKALLSTLMAGTDDAVRRHVAATLGIEPTATVDWDACFAALDWESNWHRLAVALLSEPRTLRAMLKLVRNAIGSKGISQRVFSKAYAERLQSMMEAWNARAGTKTQKVEHVIGTLTSYSQVDRVLRILREIGVSFPELDGEAAALQKKTRVRRPEVDVAVLNCALQAIARRHPSWVRAGVLAADGAVEPPSPVGYLQAMTRMFLRLTYVPQAGAASIAQHTRRRIGPIGVEPHQFNVPTEVGFVEQYDNLQYKRYDWQGWYQRMVDIHNRNVSIRCRLDDLKRLDGCGNPFVDLQTERRLRILAADRVGMGVLKLDADKYEDQMDNFTFGTTKLSEIMADARKAQLGMEYWPTVEVKVRRPGGQSQAHYSIIDDERIEQRSRELYDKYRDAKKRSLFVTPMDMWLDVKGMQTRKAADEADAQGYTLDNLQKELNDDEGSREGR